MNSTLHMLCWILFFPVYFTGHPSVAQKQYNFYYGKVLEAGTKTGIPNVNLSIEGSRIGTVTDKTGAFSFFIDSIPATLIVSSVGLETKTILLDATSYSLNLYLSRQATELGEVEIKAAVHEAFFKDDRYAVLDYEIDSSMVYLLIYRQYLSKATIICKNLDGDTVATSAPLSFKPDRLFKDCLGIMHVLSRDSGFQVFRQDNQLHLIHPVNLKKFDDVLKNCVAATPDILFFQRVTDNGLGVEYYGVNRKTRLKNPIARARDQKKIKMAKRNPQDAQMLRSSRPPGSRDDFVAWNFVHKILYRPIKTSLYRIGDYTCIFNTPEKQMEFYDISGNYSYKLAIHTDKVNDGRWTNDILIDEITGKAYTVFIRNGTYTIYRIDLNNGLLKKRLSLFHLYPRKVRIYDDRVYYLYDVAGDPDNKMLFRQKF
ncbi:MAG: carboxypeptidase-like regulatory domain-containing protein [Bacteroidales bacterium]|nr:carboxypeptidase-like regulatory domain-containing protein [Bacteroidales bacterium]